MVHADVSSANICGYQNIEVINGWSLFVPTFKNIGTTAKIDLKTIIPKTPKGEIIHLGDGTVSVKLLDDGGNYTTTYNWQGKSLGDWAAEGETTSITNGEVMIGEGTGIAVYNKLRTKRSDGTETTSTINTDKSSALFQVSGEVDLVCKNVVPNGWSLNGNSTPVRINLKDIIPLVPNGEVIKLGDGTVSIKLLDDTGNYTTTYNWQGKTLGAWAEEGKTTPIGDEEVFFDPGKSFAVYNKLRTKKSDGTETTSTINTDKSPAILSLPKPIK